jgi:protein transport protein SEC31
LHTFIEKVTVFRDATKYVDGDLAQVPGEDADAKTYKLGALYDRYFEYADVLSAQGLVKEAVAFFEVNAGRLHRVCIGLRRNQGASTDGFWRA